MTMMVERDAKKIIDLCEILCENIEIRLHIIFSGIFLATIEKENRKILINFAE
jgi:hypothetical protein